MGQVQGKLRSQSQRPFGHIGSVGQEILSPPPDALRPAPHLISPGDALTHILFLSKGSGSTCFHYQGHIKGILKDALQLHASQLHRMTGVLQAHNCRYFQLIRLCDRLGIHSLEGGQIWVPNAQFIHSDAGDRACLAEPIFRFFFCTYYNFFKFYNFSSLMEICWVVNYWWLTLTLFPCACWCAL